MDLFNDDVATSRDTSRQGTTSLDTDYTLSIEEVGELYARAGHPRTQRSIQRYCVSGHLDARKIATAIGDKYLVTPQSVARHIAEIQEMSAFDNVATLRDMSRQVATTLAPENLIESIPATRPSAATETVMPRQVATVDDTPVREPITNSNTAIDTSTTTTTTEPEQPRQVATEPGATGESSRYVARLEHQLEMARDERDFLREQINRKDKTIDALLERDKETNYLVRGLQEMLSPLLGGGRREEPPSYTH